MIFRKQYSLGLVGAAIVLMGSLSACADRPEFVVSSFELSQSSWDSLHISTVFAHQPRLSASATVAPDVVMYTVFDANFDTLYVGDDGAISLPDKEMGDRERILIEVCGFFQDASACEQKIISASPKKVEADYAVEFPTDAPIYQKGNVELATTLHRQVFNSDGWEQIRKPSGKELSILVYVERAPDDHVRIPISRSRTSFSLNRYDGYKDLRYHIQSSLMDADSAIVMFDLYAVSSAQPALVHQERFVLRAKTEEERTMEVRGLVERSGGQILEKVTGRFGSKRAYVFINEWSFEPLNKAYVAEYELHWQDAFRQEWSDLSGRLYVRSDGTEGSFLFLRGSERAELAWSDGISTESLLLDPLFPERDSESPADSAGPNRRRR